MKISPLLFLCLFFTTGAFGQPGDVPPNAQPGKCYAKSMILHAPEEVTETYPVYIGSDANAPGLKKVTLLHEEAHTQWVERKDRNGLPIQCLVEVPESTEELIIVKDTLGRTDYILETFTFYRYPEIRSHTEWREVICNDKITSGLVDEIQKVLTDKGYYQGELNGIIDLDTKVALTRYQRYAYLPVGNIDVETLETLNIYAF